MNLYLVAPPDMSAEKRRQIDNMWLGGLPLACLAVVAFSLIGAGLAFVVFEKIIAAIAFTVLGGAAAPVPTYYYAHRRRFKEFRIEHTNDTEKDWVNQVEAILKIENELFEFLGNLKPDQFGYDSAWTAWRAVSTVAWETLEQFDRVHLYLKNPREITKPILADELKKLKLATDQTQSISDQVLHLSIRASNINGHDRQHLEIIAAELEGFVASITDLEDISSHQLPAKTESSRHHEAYMAAETHKVRVT